MFNPTTDMKTACDLNAGNTATNGSSIQENTYRLVAISLIVEHGGPLGSIATGLHGPQPHLVLWETLQQMNTQVSVTVENRMTEKTPGEHRSRLKISSCRIYIDTDFQELGLYKLGVDQWAGSRTYVCSNC